MTTTPKSNEAALVAFMAGKAEIDALLAGSQLPARITSAPTPSA